MLNGRLCSSSRIFRSKCSCCTARTRSSKRVRIVFFSSSTELKSVMRSMEVHPAPAVANDGASLQTMMISSEPDAETKEKMRRYIVENSQLRMQLQRERQQHEESLKGKELEYEQSKVTLQEEFSKKLEENRELKGAIEEKERDIAGKSEVIADLREVVTSQKEMIAEQETVG